MYVRFVKQGSRTEGLRPEVGYGLFQVAYDLKRNGTLGLDAEDQLQRQLQYFSRHLPRPARFTAYGNPRRRRNYAVCWFKPEADMLLDRMKRLAAWLSLHGIGSKLLYARHPGYVAYEDEHQVVAEPFRSTVVSSEVLFGPVPQPG